MKKSIKSLITMLLVVLVIQMPIMVFAKATIPEATSDFYVNDFSNVFSEDEKSRLIENAVTLSDEHNGIQVVVSTIESLDGDSVENYAYEMYNQYGIGKDDMGLLILLSTGDRQIRIEVGLAMEAYINDAKAGRFIDKYAIPYLKDNKFNEGLIALQEALISEITDCIGSEENQTETKGYITPSELKTETTSNKASDDKSRSNVLQIFLNCILVIAVIAILVLIFYVINKKIKQSNEMKKRIAELSNELKNSKANAITEKLQITEEHQKEKSRILERATREKNNLVQNFEQEKEELSEQLTNLSRENRQITQNYRNLENNFSVLQDRYERVNKLHPNADDEVSNMIENEIRERDMKKAEETDAIISEVINLSANKDIIVNLHQALFAYSSLNEKQKSYVKSNISKLQQLYDKSVELKKEYEKKLEEERIRKRIEENKKSANSALQSITSIISSINIGTAENLSELKKAKEIYSNLNHEARGYFDTSVLNRVDRLTREAQADYEKKQEIERNKKLAATAVASITAIIAYISYGKARDLRKLKEAKNIYENLNYASQKYVDSSIIEKLDRLIREAKRDKEEEEEAERRRKRREEEEAAESSSRSSFGSSSHHSGFGGHSGGGGASRGF